MDKHTRYCGEHDDVGVLWDFYTAKECPLCKALRRIEELEDELEEEKSEE